jgi:hypothetical protein
MKNSLNQRLEISENKVTIKELMHFDKKRTSLASGLVSAGETDNAHCKRTYA